MSDTPPAEENVVDEFKNLGKNLVGLLTAAWDNPERKRFQEELENGVIELGNNIRREAEYFSESPTGQRIKSDVEDLGERIRHNQAQEKARQEVIRILQTANSELQRVINRWKAEEQETPSGADSGADSSADSGAESAGESNTDAEEAA